MSRPGTGTLIQIITTITAATCGYWLYALLHGKTAFEFLRNGTTAPTKYTKLKIVLLVCVW